LIRLFGCLGVLDLSKRFAADGRLLPIVEVEGIEIEEFTDDGLFGFLHLSGSTVEDHPSIVEKDNLVGDLSGQRHVVRNDDAIKGSTIVVGSS
jgi:hypothetical protein